MKKNILFISLALVLGFGFFGCQTDVNQTPSAGHYDISGNLTQTLGNTSPVEVTPKSGSSPGSVTVWYMGNQGTNYPKSLVNPENAGNYLVTFDVAAADGWNAAIDLVAGELEINTGGGGDAHLFEIPFTRLVDVMIASQMEMMLELLPMLLMGDPEVIAEILPPGVTIEDLDDIISLPDDVLVEIIYGLIFMMLEDWDTLISIIAMLGVHGDIQDGADLTTLLDLADVSLFHDAEGNNPIVGTDKITRDTIVYSTVPFDLIESVLMGAARVSFTVGELLAEIGFTEDISYPLSLDEFIDTLSPGETYENLNMQGLSFYTAASGGTMTGDTLITGVDMELWSNWPLEDAASMF